MSDAQETYTVAIAGMGKRGTHHADAFAANPRFEIVGLCDIDQERLDAAGKEFGVSYTNIDVAQMLADCRPDVFTFCTLPNLRLALVRAGVEVLVRDADGRLLFASTPELATAPEADAEGLVQVAGEPHLGASWALFLDSMFAAS